MSKAGSYKIYTTGSHRMTWSTGLVTTIAAGTASAGHLVALRNATSGRHVRLRRLEVEFLLTTAFGAAQEVGFDAFIARSYSAAHTGATALTMTGGRAQTADPATILTGRIADTGALTAGTQTLDANPIARGSLWCGAVGAAMLPRCCDFSGNDTGGIILASQEGMVLRNTVLMGASGVGRWSVTAEWDDVVIS